MWRISLSEEVDHYLQDNLSLLDDLIQAIDGLSNTKDGIPPEGCTQVELNFYWWEIANHIIIYTRILDDKPRLRLLIIKPLSLHG